MNKKAIKPQRRFIRALIALICVAFIPVGSQVYSVDQVEKLTVTVGYFGVEQYEKDSISLDELADSCGINQAIYTWVKGQGSGVPGTTEAEGIYIEDILDYYGIDTSQVEAYNFFVDAQAGSYDGNNQEWTNGALLGNRYTLYNAFFDIINDCADADPVDVGRNPESYYTIYDIYDFSGGRFRNGAWNSREPVRPMLALRMKDASWNGYMPPTSLDFSGLRRTASSPMLLFGQTAANESGRQLQAQMVSKLHIRFSGAPRISLTTEAPEAEVGGKTSYNVEVETPDETLTQAIYRDLIVSSGNESVAKVNDDGTVTIMGEGEADLSVTYKGTEYGRVRLTGKKKKDDEEPTNPTEDNNGQGSGSGSSSGSGDGSARGDGNWTGSGAGGGDSNSPGTGSGTADSKGNIEGSANDRNSSSDSRNRANVNISEQQQKNRNNDITNASNSTGGAAKAEVSGSNGGAASGSGDSNVKIYKISEAENSYIERVITKGMIGAIGAGAGLAVALGLAIEGIYFRRQINWMEAARKAYERI